MIMKQEIKLPVYYDEGSGSFFDQEGKRIADMRGWGWIQSGRTLEDAAKYQDELAQNIAAGINQTLNPVTPTKGVGAPGDYNPEQVTEYKEQN
jgi:hypothetical protein